MSLSKIHIRVGSGPIALDLNAKEAGQIIVIFALMLTVLIGLVGMAIDVTFAWRNGLQIQRSADAAAMAGVVYLPGGLDTPKGGRDRATAVATANGYTAGNGTSVVIAPNPDDDHQLDVTITAPVPTFFVRLFGIDNWTISRRARAGFQLPVPMGSPEAFYGVYCLTTPTHLGCDATTQIPGAAPSAPVVSHGAWGATQGTGSSHSVGDAFTAYNDTYHALGKNKQGGSSQDYDPGGYNYAVEMSSAGSIWIFDPTACAVGSQLGSGDHFNNGGANYSVSTYYTLYNMTNIPLDYDHQPVVGSPSGPLFEREYATDQSNKYGVPNAPSVTSTDGVALKDCSENAPGSVATEGRYWHDRWWKLADVTAAGTYRVNIKRAALGALNQGEDFENDWAIEAVPGAGGSARVYGLGKIVTYNIIQTAGIQSFYLAQIGPENAGKTLEIDLFDIGDLNNPATGSLQILSPDGNVYKPATFTYKSDANCGRAGLSSPCKNTAGTTSITVTDSSRHQSWQDSWLTIQIKLGPTYGCSISAPCLKPLGETQQGWWKVQYTTQNGTANDTTTWMVSLLGNPVHLVPIP